MTLSPRKAKHMDTSHKWVKRTKKWFKILKREFKLPTDLVSVCENEPKKSKDVQETQRHSSATPIIKRIAHIDARTEASVVSARLAAGGGRPPMQRSGGGRGRKERAWASRRSCTFSLVERQRMSFLRQHGGPLTRWLQMRLGTMSVCVCVCVHVWQIDVMCARSCQRERQRLGRGGWAGFVVAELQPASQPHLPVASGLGVVGVGV